MEKSGNHSGAYHLKIRSCSDGDRETLKSIEADCFALEEHVIADRIEDSQKSTGKGRRGPLFVATFVDVAVVEIHGREEIVGYCAWACEPFGVASDTCIHIMNLAVAPSFRTAHSHLITHYMCCLTKTY